LAKPDRTFEHAHDWFRTAIDGAVAALPGPQQGQARSLLWEMLGLVPAAPPDDIDLTDLGTPAADRNSLAAAVQAAAEALAVLDFAEQAFAAGGSTATALALIKPALEQAHALADTATRYPSAYSLAKILLTISGDARAANPAADRKAEKLAQMLGAAAAADVQATQTALALLTIGAGAMIDRAFRAPTTTPSVGWQTGPLPATGGWPSVHLPLRGTGVPAGAGLDLKFKTDAPSGVAIQFAVDVRTGQPLAGERLDIELQATPGAAGVFIPAAAASPIAPEADGFGFTGSVSRKGTVVLGAAGANTKVSIGEIGATIGLRKDTPFLRFFVHDGRASLTPPGLLGALLKQDVSIAFDIDAEIDQYGALRLRNGAALQTTLPVPPITVGPFKVLLISVGITPVEQFRGVGIELAASIALSLGPFQASVDRIGVLLAVNPIGAGTLDLRFKQPSGIGLSLDVGIVKGGGYVFADPSGDSYGGVLELKMLAIDVKAIAILSETQGVGFSLLLLVFGQFPAIQLSFGFTLTGIGGLIAVQHTTNAVALSQGIGSGALDAVLFPANPVANAPRIIQTLRTLFPVKAGGFVVGPMLELGWGTPSLVIVRLGLLIEAGQFAILGQAIVQLPPLVHADLALLRLQVDIIGSVVFDPLRIAFDAKLRDSRVAFITLTGQFAFRAVFGEHPMFLISAGGFHPRFREVPADIPAPFDRVGAGFDIGIVGLSFKGYFAVTSATVQAGSELRIWADVGVAAIEGGWGFDAICYIAPKFYFEVELRAYVAVHVFGEDFAGIRIQGLLGGPGRWRIAGRGTVELPLLPDIDIHLDESWGTDRDTPVVTIDLAERVTKEISAPGNWSAQLPRDGDALVTIADVQAPKALLAHPLGTLTFHQKLIPFELRLAKVSGSSIVGANEFFGPTVVFNPAAAAAATEGTDPVRDFFAAAQFLDLSQDDKMSKPSFEYFTAGYVLRNDDYQVAAVVAESLDYEEVDLGAPRQPRRRRSRSGSAFLESVHQAFMPFGAAGRSALREKREMQPPGDAAITVNPVPVTVAEKATLRPIGAGVVHHSVWQATQALTFAASPRSSIVAEVAELT
jgi:hypothetical protein